MRVIKRNVTKKIMWVVLGCIVLFGIAQFYSSWYKHEKEAIVQKEKVKEPNTSTIDQEKNTVEAVTTFNPSGSIKQSTEILKGSYPIEEENGKKQAWVGKTSKINMKAEPGKSLYVQGYVPYSFHKKANNDLKEVEVNILVNGTSVKKLTFQDDKPFDVSLDEATYKDLIKGPSFELELQAGSDYNPSKIQNSNDNRDLAMIINYIGLK